ncbi:MAG: 50S ribosomal protein L17 [Mariniphaga sp.]|nr:50S ribosomal protein L17 [Mariniphaga sp.]MDD4225622.1 50S ribosomal protein L17 [Mariniphaga sp.]MDD4425385.1 50S ribosomal protein L17 [Mariniphaga sp.]
MRHNKKFNHLGRTSSHRKALLANMASSLIESKRITTTVAKAKALRTYVEPLLTKAKDDTTHSRRIVFSQLQNKNAVSELFRNVAAKIADRPGGYTRILRTGTRLGDNAEMCIIELVDYNEIMLTSAEEAAKPKRKRSRRGTAKKSETSVEDKSTMAKSKKQKESAATVLPDTPTAEQVEKLSDDKASVETQETPQIKDESSDSQSDKETDDEAKVQKD